VIPIVEVQVTFENLRGFGAGLRPALKVLGVLGHEGAEVVLSVEPGLVVVPIDKLGHGRRDPNENLAFAKEGAKV
jgi:hypothetical protein